MKQFMKSTSIKIRFNLLHPWHLWLVNVNNVNSKTSVLIHSNLFYANSLEENQIN